MTTYTMTHLRRPLLQKVGVESDQRSLEQVKDHYKIENELAKNCANPPVKRGTHCTLHFMTN